jgi:hypothetical protein
LSAEHAFGHGQNYRTTRAEYLGALVVASGAFLWHITDIHWAVAIGLFLYIDVIGYLPGLIAYLRSETGRIHPVFHHLYNLTHTLLSAGTVVLLWCLLVGPEWALLAIAIHLFGDRGLLGNYAKPVSLPFEHFETARQAACRERMAERVAA